MLNPLGLRDTVTDNVDFGPWALRYPACTPVGGEWVPMNTFQVLLQIVGSAIAMSAIAASFVGMKRKQN